MAHSTTNSMTRTYVPYSSAPHKACLHSAGFSIKKNVTQRIIQEGDVFTTWGHGAHINLDYSSKDVAVNTKEMLGCNFA